MRQTTQADILKLIFTGAFALSAAVPTLQGAVLLLEDFETDGAGIRYTATGAFTDGADDYFLRTDGTSGASGIAPFTGFGGSWYWAAEDTDSSDNIAGATMLDFSGISLSEVPAIQISIDLGAGSGSAFDSVDDFLFVQYRIDSGPWSTALAFQNNGQTFNGPLLQDVDFDGIGDMNQVGLELQTISSAVLPVSGALLDLRIDTLMTSGSEEIAFDNIQVISVPEPGTTALVFSILSLCLLLLRNFLPRRED